ncbi:MAG: bifunctional riboflavin kinase/FAD synthetase [Actinobacteria bacterium]|nr:bifunctional riboflavin kinase/FAD synthetase [Actinomycetota bacterium]
MRVVTDLADLERCPRALAIGTFDGVHVGHRAVIGQAVAVAAERGLLGSVVTFDRHPLAVVDPSHAPRLLTPLIEKIRLIEELGPEELVLLPFDEGLAALTPAEFCDQVLAGALQARTVVVGENFNFGAGGAGDAAQLRACGAARGFDTVVVRLVTEHGKTISSTRIRRLLSHGELEEVREILGRPPSAAGLVVPGVQRGRTLGVPTANIDVEAGTIFPGRGVYAARVLVDDVWYRAAVNIGHNPTFRSKAVETTHVTVEAFLLGFSGDIYERPIRVDFLHKIRDEHRFETVAELVVQMRRDIAATADLEDPAFADVGLAAPAAL